MRRSPWLPLREAPAWNRKPTNRLHVHVEHQLAAHRHAAVDLPSMPRPIDGRGNIHTTLEWAPAFIAMDDEVVAILWAS